MMNIIAQLSLRRLYVSVMCYDKGLLVLLLVGLGRRYGIQQTEASRTSSKGTGSRWKGSVPDSNRTNKED